ncbi:MAG: cytochrome c oxidase subunit 3 family protein [Bdellovibrionaceae bacterium]|nr:cytochrome c oxidase subunit 3 family protein [Bdellovibrio sp.]
MSTSRLVNGVEVASHYRDANHQYQSNKEGLWLFMVTEILMFGGLFVGYIIFHGIYPEMFAEGARSLDWKMGFINTLVLIFSSFTMALGIYFIQVKQNKKATIALAVTIACGFVFMLIKYLEYTHKFHLGLYPGRMLHMHEGAPEHANLGMYFGFYYCMTGLHGIHVMIGMGLIGWVMIKNMRGDFNEKYFTPVEGVGIFWHIVDLIWIFLFPLLYLVG